MLMVRAADFGGEAASSVDDSLDARGDTRAVAVMGGTAGVAKTGDDSVSRARSDFGRRPCDLDDVAGPIVDHREGQPILHHIVEYEFARSA
jgi:hypothetical protein